MPLGVAGRPVVRQRPGRGVASYMTAFAIAAGGAYGAVALLTEDKSQHSGVQRTAVPNPRIPTVEAQGRSECPRAPAFTSGKLGAVAYEASGGLHVVRVSSGKKATLRPEGVRANDLHPVAWSPSGRWIASGPGDLVPAVGGPVCRPLEKRASGFQWSPTGDRFVAQTENGALWQGKPSGAKRRLLPPNWGVDSYAFHTSGHFLAVARLHRAGPNVPNAGIWMLDLAEGTKTQILPLRSPGPTPRIATWSPDGQWILYWETVGLSASLSADGGPLKAVSVSGGEPVTVVNEMLFYRDFLTWCDDALVATAGGGREVTVDKHLVAASPPDWSAERLEPARDSSVFWPDCSPEGVWVAASATPNRSEERFGSLERRVVFFPVTDPSAQGGFSVYYPRLSAEFPRWSRNRPGRYTTMLFVGRSPKRRGEARLFLQQGKKQVQLARIGTIPGYYGAFPYESVLDWYQP